MNDCLSVRRLQFLLLCSCAGLVAMAARSAPSAETPCSIPATRLFGMEVSLFHGSIPLHVQKIVMEHVRGWTCKAVYVGCSGNFTIERLLASLNRFDFHSNDITIYSSTVGAYFAGAPLRLALATDAQSEFGWLEEYLRTPSHALATVMLATALIPLISSEGTIRQGAYHQRVYAGLRKQWKTLHQKTTEKIEGIPLKLASFACRDVAEWIDDVPEDAGFISYPPFSGADKAFQRDFAKLDRLFDWDRPSIWAWMHPPDSTRNLTMG